MNLCLPYWKSQAILCGLESGHPEIRMMLMQITYTITIDLIG